MGIFYHMCWGKRVTAVCGVLLGIVLFSSSAHALITIDITRGNIDPMPIAIPAFGSTDEALKGMGEDISEVALADLERSGLFRRVNPRAFLQDIYSSSTLPNFSDWRKINATALVAGGVAPAAKEEVGVEFRLWDIFAEQQVSGKSYSTHRENWRRISHMVADEIYTRLTGEKGYFDSRIVYIAESGPADKRIKRLAIMDQDGANHKYLSSGKSLVLTPRFDPGTQRILYLSYANDTQPRVHMRDLETGYDQVVGSFAGMSFAPRFAPDGNSVIMAVTDEGNSNIYTYDLRTRKKTRLTNDASIDVSPDYAPDSKQVVFNSDRGGSQQLYVMAANGKNVRRISFGSGKYGSPAWSPRGDLIAFTKMNQGKFYIGVMRPDGSGERLLTESFMDESPTWSPNGRVIMFARQTPTRGIYSGKSEIYTIDLTGYNEQKVSTPGEASDPAWSPLL